MRMCVLVSNTHMQHFLSLQWCVNRSVVCVVQCVTAMKNAAFRLTVLMTVHVSVNPEPQDVAVTPAYLDTPGELMDQAAQVSCCHVSKTTVAFLMKTDELILSHIVFSEKVCDEESLVCQNGGTCINFQRCVCPDNFTGAQHTPKWT